MTRFGEEGHMRERQEAGIDLGQAHYCLKQRQKCKLAAKQCNFSFSPSLHIVDLLKECRMLQYHSETNNEITDPLRGTPIESRKLTFHWSHYFSNFILSSEQIQLQSQCKEPLRPRATSLAKATQHAWPRLRTGLGSNS